MSEPIKKFSDMNLDEKIAFFYEKDVESKELDKTLKFVKEHLLEEITKMKVSSVDSNNLTLFLTEKTQDRIDNDKVRQLIAETGQNIKSYIKTIPMRYVSVRNNIPKTKTIKIKVK